MSDKLKPVRCGCGGEAKIKHWETMKRPIYIVACEKCYTATRDQLTEAEAIEAWNTAMGGAKLDWR